MKRAILVFILLATYALLTHAVPAKRGPISVKQSDGSTLTILLHGDEHAHYTTSLDGYPLLQNAKGTFQYATLQNGCLTITSNSPVAHNPGNRPESEKVFIKSLVLPATNTSYNKVHRVPDKISGFGTGFPTKGKVRGLIILVNFQDAAFTYPRDLFTRMMNKKGFDEYKATGSARDYFISQSDSLFQPQFDVVGPVKLGHSESYYGGNDPYGNGDKNAAAMITEACKLADDSVNYADYDCDNNGKVDMVFVMYAGYGENDGAPSYTIWPHEYNLSASSNQITLDGKTIDVYACSCELNGNSGSDVCGVGTFCHEFGHVLGLPDLYNTDDSSKPQLGTWDIMDYGPYNNDGRTPPSYSALERYSLNWLEPTELNEPQNKVELTDLNESHKAYRLSTGKENEFFLLENHQQKGWDKYQGGKGMLITHVDYDHAIWLANTVNNDTTHQRVKLMAADNKVEYINGIAGDPFPGTSNNTAFTDESTPSAMTWNGNKLDRRITNIALNEGIITFDFMNDHLITPVANEAADITTSGFKASWSNVEGADKYNLYLYKRTPTNQVEKALEEDFSLMKAGTTDNPDATDIASSLDKYTSTSGWTGKLIFQAGGYCKLGSTGAGGSLSTPTIDLSAYKGIYTVVLNVQSYGKLTPYFQLTAGSATAKHKISGKETTYLYVLHNGTNQSSLTFAGLKERAFINDIHILRGDASNQYPNATVITVEGTANSPEKSDSAEDNYVDEAYKVINDINATSYVVNGLEMGTPYSYRVQAVSTTKDKVSNLSNKIIVKTAGTGLNDIKESSLIIRTTNNFISIEGIADKTMVRIFTATGMQVAQRTATEGGTIQMQLPGRGIYIVKVANIARKIVIE